MQIIFEKCRNSVKLNYEVALFLDDAISERQHDVEMTSLDFESPGTNTSLTGRFWSRHLTAKCPFPHP